MAGQKGKSGGARPGAGRPPKDAFRAAAGDYVVFQEETTGEIPKADRLGKILTCSTEEIEIQVGNTIFVIRFPADGEIGLR